MKEKVIVQYVKELNYCEVERLIEKILPKESYRRIIIKPNLCFAKRIPGATTSPELIGYVTEYFVKKAEEVIVVESDALLNTADEAFDNLGIRKNVLEKGGKIINLSKMKGMEYVKKDYGIPLLTNDLLVNLPVMKTHEFALVTGALKNLFGLIPDKRRIKYHPILEKVLIELARVYSKQLIIVDGINAMEAHGPTRGKVVRMNVLIGGTNPAAVDRALCKIMGIELNEVPYIQKACSIFNPEGVEIKCDGIELKNLVRKFERPKLDPITNAKMWVWRHSILNDILFASPLYAITRNIGLPIRKFIRSLLKMEKID